MQASLYHQTAVLSVYGCGKLSHRRLKERLAHSTQRRALKLLTCAKDAYQKRFWRGSSRRVPIAPGSLLHSKRFPSPASRSLSHRRQA